MSRPVTKAATFCATLVDEWLRCGVTAAYIAPGSRSTPLALALHGRVELTQHVFHDERSAAFAALGHGLATQTPAIILCSSGTAGTHFHGTVVEADLSAVPLIVVTADRPPELQDVGAPQTINQTNLYGPVVRGFFEPGVPEDTNVPDWRTLANNSASLALGSAGAPGPVHINLGFRDPLDGLPAPVPPAGPDLVLPPPQCATDADVLQIADLIADTHGIVVAGAGLSDPSEVAALASHLGWPLIADQRSGCSSIAGAIVHADLLSRSSLFVETHQPETVLRFGEQQASKSLGQWIANGAATVVAATPHGRRIDPDGVATMLVPEHGLASRLRAEAPNAKAPDLVAWQAADQAARDSILSFASANPASEITVARSLFDSTPDNASVVVSSSMPIRQLEWFGGSAGTRTVYSNRGANGIDGVIATSIGVATSGCPTYCLIGDVAFLHDASSLTALSRRDVELTIVVVDNDGGGIFSHLPQASNLDAEQFDVLFGTPHGTDLAALAEAHGLDCQPWDPKALSSGGGVRILVATSDRKLALSEQGVLIASAVAAIEASVTEVD